MVALIEALSALGSRGGGTAEAAAERDRLEAERRTRADEAVKRHGSPEAVFAETPAEAALGKAAAPFVEDGRLHPHFAPRPRKMADGLAVALTATVPLPATVVAALAAYDASVAHASDRYALDPDWMSPVHLDAWRHLLEQHLDTLPATSFADVQARTEWMQRVLDFGMSRDVDEDQDCLDALRADLKAIAEGRIPVAVSQA